MDENNGPTPQEEADRIRLKRLAKLGGPSPGPSRASPITPGSSNPPTPQPTIRKPVASTSSPKPTPPIKPTVVPTSSPIPAKKKVAEKLNLPTWEHNVIGNIFQVTLDGEVAARSGHEIVWLKHLAEELVSENPGSSPRLSEGIIDQILIARLELDPNTMSDDLDFLPVLVSLPREQTVFEYLVGCWKRINVARSSLLKRGYPPVEAQTAAEILEKIRTLVISYAGLTLQEPEVFPQPSGRPLGPLELVNPLLSLSALSTPLLGSSSSTSPGTLTPSDIEQFLQDLARRFEPDNEIDGVLGPVITHLLFHESLFRPAGLGGADAGWRGVIGGLEALVSIKSIAVMITRMDNWIPQNATAATFERLALFGPLLRLGVFTREWPGIATAYFADAEKQTREQIQSSHAGLRGTVKSLQSSLFQVFNSLVRASPESREAVLKFFAAVIRLNVKRAGMQVEPDTVASDSFMVNLQAIMLRFAEPFMDANYSKMDRIDPLYYARSERIDLKDETRIKATSEEASEWERENSDPSAPPQNFISEIFYLTVAMSHYGFLKTIQSYNELAKVLEDGQRHLEWLQGDGSWMGTPRQARLEAAINNVKTELAGVKSQQLAYETQLLDPELVFRSIGFTYFLSTWLIRQVDPKKKHPNPSAELPLPKEVPMAFRVLPEYIVEDIVDYLYFAVQNSSESFELAGKVELLHFILTFLTSTWYITNPFLKSKINDVLFMGIWQNRNERNGILGNLLNSHPVALKNLMPALMNFYIEVEQTGASSQFYDKFNARRNISYVLKVVWDNLAHREALNIEAKNVDRFVKFVNLMINDVTYLMDESLSELTSIHNIQTEMEQPAWNTQTQEYRRDRENQLRSLERHASGYTTLGRSTVELLKVFTAETKQPFMMPEIVDRLAAMLNYNLDALAGPRCQDLKVREPQKLRFEPRVLLSDILQVYLNLADQGEFVQAVANDGRSYRKELFEKAAGIAMRKTLKSETEVEKLRLFVVKVEEAKATMEAEEDLGEIPDEFLDPLMFTVMRDPVTLPSSRTIVDRSTIKSHLLSDSKDPFNRMPLAIEDVIPNTELKERIESFLSERRNKNTALDKPEEDIVHMDTEEA
ncbi:hypothetical protein HGRIS_006400 [Hohenbuehelia grisea]|uniref:U-box domain-containing protein n=1 Tax=Hohenbuehelia grisea TaxID=104357 RepID=A0ABR3K1J4_9AGAR